MSRTSSVDESNDQESVRTLVLILNWNGIDNTLSCLNSITTSMLGKVRVLVIDNGSNTDEAAAIESALDRKVYTLRLERNLGFASAANLGISYALRQGMEFILFLNNDTELDPEALEELLCAAQVHKDGAVFGPLIIDYSNRERIRSAGGKISVWRSAVSPIVPSDAHNIRKSHAYRTGWLEGSAILVRMRALAEVGPFDPSYFCYREETDLELRMLRKGWSLYCVPRAVVYHKGAASTHPLSGVQINGMTKNRFIFLMKFATASEIMLFTPYYLIVDLPFNSFMTLLRFTRLKGWSGVFMQAKLTMQGLASGVVCCLRRMRPS